MKIDWKSRIKNKAFWITFIPAVLLFVQMTLKIFGVSMDFGDINNKLIDTVNAAFYVLVILGVVNNPKTSGFSDNENEND